MRPGGGDEGEEEATVVVVVMVLLLLSFWTGDVCGGAVLLYFGVGR